MIIECYKTISSKTIVKTTIPFSKFAYNPWSFPQDCLLIKVPAIMHSPNAIVTWKHVSISITIADYIDTI